VSNKSNGYPCPHRAGDRCLLGRFRGRPSLGSCAIHCDIGIKLVWPTISAQRQDPRVERLMPPLREGCCGDGPSWPTSP